MSAPKNVIWIVGVVIGLLALIDLLGIFSLGSISAGWLASIAFAILALAKWLKGLET